METVLVVAALANPGECGATVSAVALRQAPASHTIGLGIGSYLVASGAKLRQNAIRVFQRFGAAGLDTTGFTGQRPLLCLLAISRQHDRAQFYRCPTSEAMLPVRQGVDMRCFVGVPVTPSLAQECRDLARAEKRPTAIHNFHMTLAFLGNIDQAQAETVSFALDDFASSHAALEVVFNRAEPFPRKKGPFLALTAPVTQELARFNDDLQASLKKTGYEPQARAFRPHITLARSCASPTPVESEWRMPVTELQLYQSETGGAGPVYKVLSRHRLGG